MEKFEEEKKEEQTDTTSAATKTSQDEEQFMINYFMKSDHEIYIKGSLAEQQYWFSPEKYLSADTRKDSLIILKKIIAEWVTQCLPNHKNLTHKLLIFGSESINGYLQDSDIDILCCTLPEIHLKSHFLIGLTKVLKSHPTVSFIETLEDIRIPIIKAIVHGTKFDISHCNLEDINSLSNIKELAKVKLGGIIANNQILEEVPNPRLFSKVLRLIKYWAKRKGIYSFVLGYFNGTVLSQILFKLCCKYPDLEPLDIVQEFFEIKISEDPRIQKYTKICPITQKIISKYFTQGRDLMRKLQKKLKSDALFEFEREAMIRATLTTLIRPLPTVMPYENFVQINIYTQDLQSEGSASGKALTQEHLRVVGFVKSRITLLLMLFKRMNHSLKKKGYQYYIHPDDRVHLNLQEKKYTRGKVIAKTQRDSELKSTLLFGVYSDPECRDADKYLAAPTRKLMKCSIGNILQDFKKQLKRILKRDFKVDKSSFANMSMSQALAHQFKFSLITHSKVSALLNIKPQPLFPRSSFQLEKE
ncbi:unnamed protein product [Moneuplotes crassus]|uniref:polynucleotide adenylyltransferase n=1 Tax=Euplotes crassus TaxID=5936 RepID=A0AAD1U700_EUPCR|nr:unnamed protein product [Moneuplotes crassus]